LGQVNSGGRCQVSGITGSEVGVWRSTFEVGADLNSEEDHGDAAIRAAEVGIAFEFRVEFQQLPSLGVGSGPIFAKDTGANSAVVLKFPQTFLDSDPKIAAHPAGAVAVDELKGEAMGLTRDCEFALQLRERLSGERHASLEVDRTN